MPRHDDYFRSHMFPGDPRTPLHAAGGCIWPTVPAQRYLLKSTTATGVLVGLNTQGILMEKTFPDRVAHDETQYSMIAGPVPVIWGIGYKRIKEDGTGYTWEFAFIVSLCGAIAIDLERPIEKCNKDFLIGDWTCSGTSDHTGADFTAYQVVYNKSVPPTYP